MLVSAGGALLGWVVLVLLIGSVGLHHSVVDRQAGVFLLSCMSVARTESELFHPPAVVTVTVMTVFLAPTSAVEVWTLC